MIIEGDVPFPGIILEVMSQVIPLILESNGGYIMLKCKWIGIGELRCEGEVR